MQTITILTSLMAAAVSLLVTLPVLLKARRERMAGWRSPEVSAAEQRLRHIESIVDQARHMEPSRLASRRNKIDKAERLLTEVVAN